VTETGVPTEEHVNNDSEMNNQYSITLMVCMEAEEATVPYIPEVNELAVPFLVEKDNTELG
jgi:hypothetical protein